VNFQVAVVIDESRLPKFIHEGANARPRGPDNLGRVSFEQIFALIGSGFPSLPKLADFNF
jgi:hypothetical protein